MVKVAKNLSNETRLAVFRFLLSTSVNGKLKKGSVKEAALKFATSQWTIRRIWNRGNDCTSATPTQELMSRVSSKLKHNAGRKRKFNDEQISEIIEKIPESERSSIRSMASSTKLSIATIRSYLKRSNAKTTSSDSSHSQSTQTDNVTGSGYIVVSAANIHAGPCKVGSKHTDKRIIHDLALSFDEPGKCFTSDDSPDLVLSKLSTFKYEVVGVCPSDVGMVWTLKRSL